MKKIMIVITLLLTCFWCVNVKADGEDLMTVVDEEPATVEVEEAKEEKQEEDVTEENKAEEPKEEIKEENKEEKKEEVPTRAAKAVTHYLNIELYNTRTGEDKIIGSASYKSGTSRKKLATYSMLDEIPNERATVYKEENCDGNGLECEFTLLGWHTADGTEIEFISSINYNDIPTQNDTYLIGLYLTDRPSSIQVAVGQLSEDVNIKLYTTWSKKYLEPQVEPGVRLQLFDTRSNASGDKVFDETYANQTLKSTLNTYQYFSPLANAQASYYDETDSIGAVYRNTFLGWYTESGEKVTSDSFVSGLDSGIDLKLANADSPTALYLKVGELDDLKTIKLYSKWERVLHDYPFKLTINFMDSRPNRRATVLADTKTFDKNKTNERVLTYSMLQLASASADHIDEKISDELMNRYTFLGWFNENDEQVVFDSEMSFGEKVKIRRAYEDLEPSSLYISVLDLTEDVEISLYAKWDVEEVEIPNENYKVNVEFYDTRVDENGTKVGSKVIENGSSNSPVYTYSYFGFTSPALYIIEDEDAKYYFDGWYTEDGTKIEYDSYTTLLDENLKIKKKSSDVNTTLEINLNNVKVDDDYDPSNNPTVKLYAKWTKTSKSVRVYIHLYDNREDFKDDEFTFDASYNELDSDVSGNVSDGLPSIYQQTTNSEGTMYLDLNKIFNAGNQNALIGGNSYSSIGREDFVVTRDDDKTTKYTFLNWKDSAGNIIGSDGYKVPESDSNVISKYELIDTTDPSSGAAIKKELVITIKSLLDIGYVSSGRVDINIYAEWDEHINGVITLDYIDKIAHGSGSFASEYGGADSYTHTFSEPADIPDDYQFLYWILEEPAEEDDQIDPTREYKPGDMFEYSVVDRPSEWEGRATAYAYYQSNVTVYLYDEGKMLGDPLSSFESVTVDTIPTKEAYRFLGWTDKDGNDVTDLTFYPDKIGVEPKPIVVNLYAKWVKLINITIHKEWSGDEGDTSLRSSSVTIRFFIDGEYEDIELSEDNNWTCYFEGLPANNADGSVINYSVEEIDVPEGYVVAYELEANDDEQIFTVHNVLGQGDGEPDEPTNNPQTGDNIGLYLVTLIGSLSGLVLCVKKYNFE